MTATATAREIWNSAPPSTRELTLRQEVRAFLHEELGTDHLPGLGIAAPHSPEFTRKLAARGWVGMAIPQRYGGTERPAVERFIVTEELLAAGAPIGAHFIAERQTAPMLMRFGTEQQRLQFLPAICRGELWFSLGMSEPDAGSDLASVRTTATPVEGGFTLRGTKVWTTNAHLNHFMVTLCRTAPAGERKHEGLSQLIVDLAAPGVEIQPIEYLNGRVDFNEVNLDEVFVPHAMVLGELGSGWRQVTSELAFERSGPDRVLSTFGLLRSLIAENVASGFSAEQVATIGYLSAHYWSIRQLSLAVARAIDHGAAPGLEAAMVKDLGTKFEQRVVELVRLAMESEVGLGEGTMFAQLLAEGIVTQPGFTLRGGTTEVLRSMAAKAYRP